MHHHIESIRVEGEIVAMSDQLWTVRTRTGHVNFNPVDSYEALGEAAEADSIGPGDRIAFYMDVRQDTIADDRRDDLMMDGDHE